MVVKAVFLFSLAFSQILELDDDSFEDHVQADNGNSGYEWFILFYDDDSKSQELLAEWDQLPGLLKEENVRIVKMKYPDNGITASRMRVKRAP